MSEEQKKEIQKGVVRVFLMFVVLSIYSMGIAYAVEMPDAVDAAERVDRMGAVGVLAFGFILSLATTGYLVRCLFGKLMQVIDNCTKTLSETNQTMQQVNTAIQHCREK